MYVRYLYHILTITVTEKGGEICKNERAENLFPSKLFIRRGVYVLLLTLYTNIVCIACSWLYRVSCLYRNRIVSCLYRPDIVKRKLFA